MAEHTASQTPDVHEVRLIDEATKQEILTRYEIQEHNEVAIFKLCCIIHTLEQMLKSK